MNMRTIIINGSPRINGDTAALIAELRRYLDGEVIEISAYRSNISPCVDCRACWEKFGCVIDDDMSILYSDDFGNVVIASPIYISNLPGQILNIASRFQAYYAAQYFLKQPPKLKPKRAGLILVGGGDGSINDAVMTSAWMFKRLNASGYKEHTALSLNTNILPTVDDSAALGAVREIAEWLNDKER